MAFLKRILVKNSLKWFPSPTRAFSKASKATEREFWRRTPVKYELLAEFYLFEKPEKNPQSKTENPEVNLESKTEKPDGNPESKSDKSFFSVSAGGKTIDNISCVEDLNHAFYLESINRVICNFKHQTYRTIPHLNPGLPGSVNSWREIAFHTERSTLYLLCGMFNLSPVASRTSDSIVFFDKGLKEHVAEGYYLKMDDQGGLYERNHNFGLCKSPPL